MRFIVRVVKFDTMPEDWVRLVEGFKIARAIVIDNGVEHRVSMNIPHYVYDGWLAAGKDPNASVAELIDADWPRYLREGAL